MWSIVTPVLTQVFVVTKIIEIVFDPIKDLMNASKHGVSLSLAAEFDGSSVLSKPDDRHDYREPREIGYAPLAGRLYCVVFTQRGMSFRIISLREASNREMERYERVRETSA